MVEEPDPVREGDQARLTLILISGLSAGFDFFRFNLPAILLCWPA